MIPQLKLNRPSPAHVLSYTMRQGPDSIPRNNVVRSLFNGSGKPNRPMSNLLGANKYTLSDKDFTSFAAFATMLPKTWRNSQSWAAVWTEAAVPGFPIAKELRKIMKERKESLNSVKVCQTLLASPVYCSIKMTAMGAEVRIPVLALPTNVSSSGQAVISESSTKVLLDSISSSVDGEAWKAANQVLPNLSSLSITNTANMSFAYLSPKDRNIFKNMGATLSVSVNADMQRLFLEFTLTREQVSYLCTNEFDDVRPVDLYGFVRVWAQGRIDPSVALPQTTKPLADIVATLPTGGEQRTNSDDLLIDFDSMLLYIPRKFDNVSRYDIALSVELTEADGTLTQNSTTNLRPKTLPAMQNVLIDWVNKKWSYVNGAGNLEVRDLSRARPVSISHVRAFLSEVLTKGETSISFISRASNLSSKVGGRNIAELNSFILNGVKLLQLNPKHEGTRPEEFSLYYIGELANMYDTVQSEWANEHMLLEPYWELCHTIKLLAGAIKKNEDAYYKDYSVLTISQFLAQAIIFDKYARNFEAVDQQDRTDRAKYTAPNLDPNYKLPDIPYMAKERGLMPHQLNVCNMLRDSPDNAIIAVQAGGGKTPIGVVDILKEMKQGVRGPFLVLCPSHLVSQYVQEFTHFTDGRVNVVAVTKYTIESLGFDALQKTIESAPVNTVVIGDYGLANGQMTVKVGYGTSSTEMYQIVEFLRQFRFQYVICDESHKLKNTSATVSRAVATLIADIPKKRLASGTFMDNSPSDVAGQMSLLDPTIFGSEEKFNSAYSESGATTKISKYRPGAEAEIMNKLTTNTRYISVKRKEWAAALPPREESMDYMVTLSPEQRRVYNTILQESMEDLELAAQTNPKLAALLGLKKGEGADKEQEEILNDLDEDEKGDTDLAGGLDRLLYPYLARLETFVCAPGMDLLGNIELKGDDRLSPKLAELINIFRNHVEVQKIPGKVLVFANQGNSAQALYDNLPPDIKKRTIHFEAARRDECGAEFETNPNKMMMIGISQGMDTGLNLQFCFPGDTYVMTDYDKCAKLEDVYNTDSVTHVLSYDLKSRKIERKEILQKTRNVVRAKDRYVAVKIRDLNTGVVTQQICTDNHQFILKGGKDIAAGDLQPGNKLVTYGGDFRKLKIEPQSGELVDSFTRLNVQCQVCGDWVDGTAMAKHKAVAHGIEVKRYEEIRVVRSENTASLFEDDDYRIRHSNKMKEVSSTPEARSAMSKRGKKSWLGNDERRANATLRSSERWADPEYKARVGAAIAEFYATDEGKIKTANATKASVEYWASDEGKANRAAKAAAYWTPERREAKGAEFRAMWADDDMRDYIMDKMAETANDPELVAFKSKMTAWLHANVDGYTEKGISAMIRAQGTLPNKPERNVIDLGIKGLEYTGDGKYFVTMNLRGKKVVKNPDFISTNHSKNGRTRKVVEVIGCREFTGRDAEYVADLKQAYAAIGIECLVIDAKYCYEKADRFDDVKPLLESFINNHYLEVLSVREVTNPDQIGKYKYDLTVEGNHNYFVVANMNGANSGTRPTTPVLVHNCSRLVRVETVMSPGALEQGNARVGRPNIKVKETRPKTYYDWILADNTIDITKVAYLMTKKVRIAVVEEASNPLYLDLAQNVPELFRLSMDNIRVNNTIDTLAPYLSKPNGVYRRFLATEALDYKTFRDEHPEILNAEGKLKMSPLERSENIEGSSIIRRIPYVPGLHLYGADTLGLIRLDQYLKVDEEEALKKANKKGGKGAKPGAAAQEDEDSAGKNFSRDAYIMDFRKRAIGLAVHTESGEGKIKDMRVSKVAKPEVLVELDTGEVIYLNVLAIYVITKPQTCGADIRGSLAKMSGDIPIDTPWVAPDVKVTVPSPAIIAKATKRQKIVDSKGITIALSLVVTNDMVGLCFEDPASDKKATKILEAMKFVLTPKHVSAVLKTPEIMDKFFMALVKKGYSMPKPQLTAIFAFYTKWKSLRKNVSTLFGVASATQQKNFYTATHKPNVDKNMVVPYISVDDGVVNLCLPTAGYKGNMHVATTVKVTGVKFYTEPPKLIRYFNSPAEIIAMIKRMPLTGITLTNEKELHAAFCKLHKEVPKGTKQTMDEFFSK